MSILILINRNYIAFDEIINESANNSMPLVIDFQKSNCRPCKLVAPKFIQLSRKYGTKVNFYKVDADSSTDAKLVLKSNTIKAVPTFIVYINGKQVENIQGAKIDELDECLSDLVEKQ